MFNLSDLIVRHGLVDSFISSYSVSTGGKLSTLNKSESSSVKPKIVKKKVESTVKNKPEGTVLPEVTVTAKKPQSFGSAFKENKKAGKKEFTWKGKKYHTRTKDEEAATAKATVTKTAKTKVTAESINRKNAKKIVKVSAAKEGEYYKDQTNNIDYQFKDGKYVKLK